MSKRSSNHAGGFQMNWPQSGCCLWETVIIIQPNLVCEGTIFVCEFPVIVFCLTDTCTIGATNIAPGSESVALVIKFSYEGGETAWDFERLQAQYREQCVAGKCVQICVTSLVQDDKRFLAVLQIQSDAVHWEYAGNLRSSETWNILSKLQPWRKGKSNARILFHVMKNTVQAIRKMRKCQKRS